MLRLPLVLVSAVAGMLIVTGLVYALPEVPALSAAQSQRRCQLAQRKF